MAFLIVLSGLQLLATLGGGALLWRRLDRATREIERLRKALNAAESQVAVSTRRRVHGADSIQLAETPRSITELRRREINDARAAASRETAATLSPETARGLSVAVAAALPALAFFISGATAPVIVAGLVVAASLMLVALRPLWRVAAWGAVIAGGAWTLAGFALGVAAQAPGAFCTGLLVAGVAGLAHAHLRRAWPGVTLALLMSAAALALGSQIGLIGAAGAAFGALVAVAATIGALSLRLESVHLCAFAAGLIGLFALSGQHDAAIWFTPVTTWFGAAFLGIAVLRIPELGARGLAIAGTGVLAAVGSIAALHASRHGLADPFAAAVAFTAVALVFVATIVSAARHDQRGLAALGLTLWVLAGGAWFALCMGMLVALPAPLAATAFAALALGLAVLDWRTKHAVWRTLAWISGGFAALMTAQSALMVLVEAANWSPWLLIILGVALPAALAGASAACAERARAPLTASVFETFAILCGVLAANLALRTLASNGALLLAPIGFAEAGLHIAIWLGAALALAARAKFGAQTVRGAAVVALGAISVLACATAALLWLTPHWSVRPAAPLLQFAALGYLAPALLFWAHFAFWRKQAIEPRTRAALAAGALLTAAFITMLTLQARAPGVDWVSATVGALCFALAIGVNFAPGVTAATALDFHKYFHRPRTDQARREAG